MGQRFNHFVATCSILLNLVSIQSNYRTVRMTSQTSFENSGGTWFLDEHHDVHSTLDWTQPVTRYKFVLLGFDEDEARRLFKAGMCKNREKRALKIQSISGVSLRFCTFRSSVRHWFSHKKDCPKFLAFVRSQKWTKSFDAWSFQIEL